MILALLSSVISLLAARVADALTNTTHDPNGDLVGQGIGNAVAGLIGGLPASSAAGRTDVKACGDHLSIVPRIARAAACPT